MVVTQLEKQFWANFWQEKAKQLKQEGSEYAEPISWFGIDSIGYNPGQIRPGDLGKWDMYFFLCQWENNMSQRSEKIAKVCDLDFSEIKRELDREDLCFPEEIW